MTSRNSVQGESGIRLMLMLVGAMTLAGSSVVVGKVLVGSLPVFLAAFASLMVAFLCMIPLMYGRISELGNLTRKQWTNLFLQGLCGIVLFRVFTLYGLHSAGAVQAGIITGTTPAVLALLSLFLLGEPLTKRGIAGLACAVSGCLFITSFNSEVGIESNLLGCVLVGAAVFCEALFTIFRKQVAESVSAITNTTVLIFCSLILLIVPAALDLRNMTGMVDATIVFSVIYYGVFATVLAYLLWTSAVGKVSGQTAGVATAAMPASSVLLAALVLGEPVLWHHFIGCLMIVLGIVVSSVQLRPTAALNRVEDHNNR